MVGITRLYINYHFPVLYFSERLVCVFVCVCVCVCFFVFCLVTPFISVLFVFQSNNHVLLHLINKHMTSASE